MTSQTLMWTAAAVLSGFFWLAPAVQAQSPSRAVIVDTDAGDDDVMALAFLLARPDVRLEAITISYGLAHQKPGAQNVLRPLSRPVRDHARAPIIPSRRAFRC